ncbi:NUDIX domain-containing protein [Brachybacterium sp. MASK1Z-5]|uniref:NUDIX domain-containing protein n=1 Tax=Brachybacterium halotolerans TaxID=2795215 RepID=A0ABS1BAF4_9MICO|nr:NUDIX domain-containing protein [Brachybacterium halotolerans]MBK0331640.1 NUDIX domain-containing protein [Brachybacterium halotolerans]
MEQQGISQWRIGSLDTAQISVEVARGEWHVLDPDGTPDRPGEFEAAVRLVDDDPYFWSQHERAEESALYVHGLMTDPSAGGRGLGAQLLDLAWAEAGRRRARWLRLDCAPHLLDYYRPKGFTPVGRKETDEFVTMLLEKPAPGDPAPPVLAVDDKGQRLLSFAHSDEPRTDHVGDLACPLALVVVRAGDRVLFGKNRWRKSWELPGGICNEGETPREAAARELEEETGLMADPRDLGWEGLAQFALKGPARRELAAAFSLRLPAKPTVGPSDELTDVGWFGLDRVPADVAPLDLEIARIASTCP